jgi:hypothetical protein
MGVWASWESRVVGFAWFAADVRWDGNTLRHDEQGCLSESSARPPQACIH